MTNDPAAPELDPADFAGNVGRDVRDAVAQALSLRARAEAAGRTVGPDTRTRRYASRAVVLALRDVAEDLGMGDHPVFAELSALAYDEIEV
jgi:hypothetical protein